MSMAALSDAIVGATGDALTSQLGMHSNAHKNMATPVVKHTKKCIFFIVEEK